MRKNRLWHTLAVLTLVWSLIVPSEAAVPDSKSETASVPYPPRQFLYIVDCSGSMAGYEEALNLGRQMLLELLPAESTTVVKFTSEAVTLKPSELEDAGAASLSFGNATSVLVGLREADKQLADLWAADPNQEVTAVLFSDMLSTVDAENGAPLTQANMATVEAEQVELEEIARRWSSYVFADKLRFYTLSWPSDEAKSGYDMRFPVLPPSAESAPKSSTEVSLNADILKTCVEVYADILTGGNGTKWEEAGEWKDSSLTVSMGERYRGFLYLNEIPSCVVDSSGNELSLDWKMEGGCVVPTGGGVEEDEYTIEGVSGDVKVMSFQIPQPKLEISFSSDNLSVFNPVTITMGVSDGRNYLGYNENNSYCFLEVTAPGKSDPDMLPGFYNSDTHSYEFSYTPETLGTHEFRFTYVVLGAESTIQEPTCKKEVECAQPVLSSQQQRGYGALSRRLRELEKGSEVSFSLSDYYTSQNIRLEFVVDAPEDSQVAVWSPSTDESGAVTVKGLRGGSTILCYTINCYLEGEEVPSSSESYKLQISVQDTPAPIPYLVLAAVAGVIVACVVIIVIRRGRKHTD